MTKFKKTRRLSKSCCRHYIDSLSLHVSIHFAFTPLENASTGATTFEILNRVRIREPLTSLGSGPEAMNLFKHRETVRNDTFDAIILAQTKMTICYDAQHRILDLLGLVYIKIAETGDAGYHIPKSSSLTTKKIGPFKILKKVSPLACKIELPPSMSKVHSTNFVIHLEPVRQYLD